METLTPATVAELLEDLAQLLPFPTFVYTDMGAESWTPQLYFGPLDESSDLPTHRAGIDADTVRPVWSIDLDTGMRTILLDEMTPDDVCDVAARIIAVYRGGGCIAEKLVLASTSFRPGSVQVTS